MPRASGIVRVVILLATLPVICFGQEDTCFTSGGVAGIVIATIVVTLVMGGLVLAVIWYLWKQQPVSLNGKKPGSVFFGSEKNCALENHPEKQLKNHQQNSSKESYAFDNPYFKDDELDSSKLKNNNPDAAEKGQSGFPTDNGDVRNSPYNKFNTKPKKNRPFSNIPFPNVFHQGSKKPRALDDTCIPKHTERIEVPLRGKDFTGLGFNICGNMRDGIFVKDVLHRGPASESGKIKAGDKIVGVTVSFGGMVYEDALTILSYASPYDVKLELEKTSSEVNRVRNLVLPTSSPGSKARLASSSFRTGQTLFHPLYRSQSIHDLTQIGKDNNFHMNGIAASPSSKNGPSSGPKRSQSIEASSGPKNRVHLTASENITKGSRKSSTSSCESMKKIVPDSPKSSAVEEYAVKKPVTPEMKNSRFHVQSVVLQKKAPDVIPLECEMKSTSKVLETKEPLVTVELDPVNDSGKVLTPESLKSEVFERSGSLSYEDKSTIPQAPPRKSGGHGKRKAPAPPKSITETSAIVHRNADEDNTQGDFSQPETESEDVKYPTPESDESDKIADESPTESEEREKIDTLAVVEESTVIAKERDDANSSPKRKAASLGDLTKLDEKARKKFPPATTILERAVSLDLQQSLPEENLIKQKMTLKSPTFENPEDTSEEDCVSSGEKSVSGNLKRWEGSWYKLQEEIVDSADADKENHGLWPSPVKTNFSIINGHSEVITHPEMKDSQKPDMDSSLLKMTSTSSENSTRITSTPVKNVVDSFFKGDVDIDDIPYLGDQSSEDVHDVSGDPTSPTETGNSNINSKTTIPISLSIPVIRPNFSNYEKLPSPLPSKSLSPDISTNSNDSSERPPLTVEHQDIMFQELSSAQSTYKPVFSTDGCHTSKATESEDHNKSDISDISALSVLDIVNGNGLEISTSSYGQYRTASEESSSSSTAVRSSMSSSLIEPKPEKEAVFSVKKHSLPEISGIKVHSGVAGFAKTLIISTPIEGESITFNDDLDSLPPKLEPQL